MTNHIEQWQALADALLIRVGQLRKHNNPAASTVFEMYGQIEEAIKSAQHPETWLASASADVSVVLGLQACECGQWVSVEAERCEGCGAAVMPF